MSSLETTSKIEGVASSSIKTDREKEGGIEKEGEERDKWEIEIIHSTCVHLMPFVQNKPY